MHTHDLSRWQPDHASHDADLSNERRTLVVTVLTTVMMVVEVAAGVLLGSMALLADGWHMGTHAAALGLAAFAYSYARRHAGDTRFSFGTGKVSALGGFASAVALAVIAVTMAFESVSRLFVPAAIRFDEAIVVSAIGLAVNLVCAGLLAGGRHDHGHDAEGDDHAHDHNLRAAFLHVIADALTSVLAIAALICGKYLDWAWMDPVMGIVGGALIAHWSYGLLRATGRVLLDSDTRPELSERIRSVIESGSKDRVADLHIWRIGMRYMVGIVSVVSHEPKPPEHYKRLIAAHADLQHLTVEVNHCN